MNNRKRSSKHEKREKPDKELQVVFKFKENVDPEVEASIWREIFEILGVFDPVIEDELIRKGGPFKKGQ